MGGLGVVLYTAGAVAQKIVEGEFQRVLGRRRMERQTGVLTDAIKRSSGRMAYGPSSEERIDAGDSLVVLAETGQMRAPGQA